LDHPASAYDNATGALESKVKSITVAYRAGTVPLSVAGEAGEDRRQIELKLLALSPDAVEEVNKSSK
jgi:hypothetical protein